jgi:hypothetical protein
MPPDVAAATTGIPAVPGERGVVTQWEVQVEGRAGIGVGVELL